MEAKPDQDELDEVTTGEQVARYWSRYQLVLVTNLREFRLVGPDSARGQQTLETFRLADTATDFHQKLQHPRAFARAVGGRLIEYLARALAHRAALAEPKDLAWLLASYARDGLSRVEAASEAAPFESLRTALEEALGIRFEGERGKRFFQSTLVQTLFYGVFSAWVLWARSSPKEKHFDWHTAVWHLRAPVLRALFQQLSDPGRLKPLGLVEVLDWTAAALDRVDRTAFFARFREGEAVPYFYEPFLAAFDPDLRKQLGVWYTPNEIVRYMVARVDRALKDDLGIADGLAAENVYVLDPCCGTGAYLAEVLRRIAGNLEEKGLGALVGARVKEAPSGSASRSCRRPSWWPICRSVSPCRISTRRCRTTARTRAGVPDECARVGTEGADPRRSDRRNESGDAHPAAGFALEEERELGRLSDHGAPAEGPGAERSLCAFFRMAERRIVEQTGRGVV